jgi:hypothetical protein
VPLGRGVRLYGVRALGVWLSENEKSEHAFASTGGIYLAPLQHSCDASYPSHSCRSCRFPIVEGGSPIGAFYLSISITTNDVGKIILTSLRNCTFLAILNGLVPLLDRAFG